MPFDPTTATIAFDPSSAKPVGGFDPSSARELPDIPKGAQPGVTAEGIKEGGIIPEVDNGGIGGLLSRVGHALHGEYQAAASQGFGGFVARKIDELTGYAGTPYSTAKINEANGPYKQDPSITKKIQQAYEREAVRRQRQIASNEVAANSQGTNPGAFVAGVLGSADPTWLINPGQGVADRLAVKGLTKLVTKVITNAGTHAIMGSGDDAVYQLADEIDGIKKGFDIKRNLEAAAFNATFGAAHPIVSDFVTNLYKERGIDTTPDANPTGKASPLTGQNHDLTPEEHAQYQDLLNTGDEQQIKGFFDGRNGPPTNPVYQINR